MLSKLDHVAGIPFRARLDLVPDSGEVLPLSEGDIVEVLDRGSHWWIAIANGKRGLVAPECLEPQSGSMETPPLDDEPTIVEEVHSPLPEITVEASQPDIEVPDCTSPSSLHTRNQRPTLPRLVSPIFESLTDSPSLPSASSSNTSNAFSPAGSPISPTASPITDGIKVLPTRVRALLDVTGAGPGELSFKKGDIIDVDIRSSAEIWQGKVGSQTGTFRINGSVEPILKERVRALWEYTAASPGDLSFKAGDIIQVYGPSSQGTWWWHGFIAGKGIGTFPFNCVEPLDDEFDDSDEVDPVVAPLHKPHTKFRVLHDVEATEDGMLSLKQGDVICLVSKPLHDRWEGRSRSQTGSFFLDENIEPIISSRVRALYNYRGQTPEELAFAQGDIITVVKPCEESTFWWHGFTKNDVGIFPFNYIELVPDEKDDLSDSEEWIKVDGHAQPYKMRARYDFRAGERKEVPFTSGDLITFLGDMNDPQWFIGTLNDQLGIFPRSFCEEVTVERPITSPTTQSPLDLPPAYEESSLDPNASIDHNGYSSLDRRRTGITRLDMKNLHSRPGRHTRARALQDFRSGEVGDLSFTKGDIIEVLDMPTSTEWWRGRLIDTIGIFPSSLTELIDDCSPDPSPFSNDRNHAYPSPMVSSRVLDVMSPTTDVSDEKNPDAWNLVSAKAPFRPVNTPLPWTPCFARAVRDFHATEENGIHFLVGDIIEILAMPFLGRWTAKLRNRQGLIPSSHVDLVPLVGYQGSGGQPSGIKTNNSGNAVAEKPASKEWADEKATVSASKSYPTSDWVRVRHDFNSGKPRELVMKKGDLIRVLKKPRDHWWKGRLERDGTEGLFPANYVETASSPSIVAESMSQGSASPAMRPSAMEQEVAIVVLRDLLSRLSAELKAFDVEKDPTENVEIQTLYGKACAHRKRMSKLQEGAFKPQAQLQAEGLFEEVRSHYDSVMELSARRHAHEVTSRPPHVPRNRTVPLPSATETSISSFGRGRVIVDEPHSYADSSMSSLSTTARPPVSPPMVSPPPVRTHPEHTRTFPRKQSTGNSVTLSLPPTPAVYPTGLTATPPQRLSQTMSVTTPNWIPALAFGDRSQPAGQGREAARKFDGRLSAIAADIEKAKQAYTNRSNVVAQPKNRTLPSSPAVRILRRVVRRRPDAPESTGPSHATHKKTIIKHEVEYKSLHVVHSNFTPLPSRRGL